MINHPELLNSCQLIHRHTGWESFSFFWMHDFFSRKRIMHFCTRNGQKDEIFFSDIFNPGWFSIPARWPPVLWTLGAVHKWSLLVAPLLCWALYLYLCGSLFGLPPPPSLLVTFWITSFTTITGKKWPSSQPPIPPQFHVRFTQQMLIVPIYKDTSKVSPGIPGIHLHFPGISRHFPGILCHSRGISPHLLGFYHILRALLCCLLVHSKGVQ